MTLREPPKQARALNLAGRMIGLLLLLAGFALVVWTAATNQQAAAIERSDPLINPGGEHIVASSNVFHFREFGSGGRSTLMIHDDRVPGGAIHLALAQDLADTGRRVLVPDLPGYGLSSRPGEPGRHYSTAGQAESLAAFLDEMGVADIEVVGLGWGGAVALEVAVIRPDLVSAVQLVEPPSLPVQSTGWQILESLPFGVGEAVAFTREGGSDRAEDVFLATCPAVAICDDPTELEGYRRSVEVPGTARAIRARRASEPASVSSSRLEEITVPVTLLLVGSSGDDSEALEDSSERAEELESSLADASVVEAESSELARVLADRFEG